MAETSVIRKLDTPLRRIPGAFRHRSFVVMLLAVMVAIGAMCLLKHRTLDQLRQESLRRAEVRLAQKAQVRRERFLGLSRMARGYARMMAGFPSFRALLDQEGAPKDHAEEGTPEERALHVGSVMEAILETQEMATIALLDREGRVLVRRDRGPSPLSDTVLADVAREAIHKAPEDILRVLPEAGSWLLEAWAFSAGGDASSEQATGVILLALPPAQWQSFLEPVTFPEFHTEEVVLAQQEGERLRPLGSVPLAASRDSGENLLHCREPERPLPDQPDVHLARGSDYRGHAVLAVTAHLPGTPLAVIAKTDESEAIQDVLREQHQFLWILALVVLMALLFFLLLSRHYRSVAFRRMLEVENRYRVLAEQARDIILVISPEGTILEANRAAITQYGYSPEVLKGMPFEKLHVEDASDSVRAHLSEALEGQTLYETMHRRSDGDAFPVEVSARVLRRDRHFEVVAIIRDLSERRRKEVQGQISQRMEVLGQMAGGVAHDFNNLLTAIRGFASMVQESLSPEDPRYQYLEEVVTSSDRAAELTSKLLSFSRGHAIEKKVIDLNRIVQGMEALFQRLVREDIQVVLDLEVHPLWIRADPRQIETLLMNLVVNSRDAMPKGGALTIRTRLRPSKESPEAIGPSQARLIVEDTGIGMTDEVRSHAFEPFFTTKSAGQGTGLGLSTVFGIVQQHDGKVWIESAPGQGTRVFTEFPLCSPTPSEEIRAFGVPEGKLVGGDETILLVEDHPDVRSYVRTVLETFGYRVLEARDSRHALEILAHRGTETVDLLVSDVVMPGGNGIELWKQAQSLLPGLPVLFITGYAERSLFQTADLPRTAPLLQKPFQAQDLARKVRKLLDRKPLS